MLLRSIATRIATTSRTKLLTATQLSTNFAPCQIRSIHSTVSRTMSASGESESKGAGKSGITSWADSKDGSFKRQTSSFRDAIEDGAKFAPEKSECVTSSERAVLTAASQADTTSTYRWLAPGLTEP